MKREELQGLINFAEDQLTVFEMLPASDYRNGVMEGITLVLKHINGMIDYQDPMSPYGDDRAER